MKPIQFSSLIVLSLIGVALSILVAMLVMSPSNARAHDAAFGMSPLGAEINPIGTNPNLRVGFDTIPFTGATGDGTTNDQPVLQAEIDRLCLLPEEDRIMKLPPGDFVIGESGVGSFYAENSLMLDECNGFKLIGSGRELTRLITGHDQGQVLITICDFNNDQIPLDCNNGSDITYRTYISDLALVDLDPIASGGQNAIVVVADAVVGTAPVGPNEVVTWAGGAYSAFFNQIGSGLRYVLTEPTPNASGTFTGVLPIVGVDTLTFAGGGTASNITSTRGEATEGTHGITTKYAEDITMERIHCDGISDECIDIKINSKHIIMRDITSVDVGSVGEGGSVVAIDGGDFVVLDGFDFNLGDADGGDGKSSGIDIGTNNSAIPGTQNIYIQNGKIYDTGATEAERAEFGLKFSIQHNNAVIRNTHYSNVLIDMDHDDAISIQQAAAAGVTGTTASWTISNSTVNGPVKRSNLFEDGRAIDTVFFTNQTVTYGFDSFRHTSGCTFNAPNAVHGITITNLDQGTFNNNYVGPVGSGDCVDLGSAGWSFTGNVFNTCGGGGGDHGVAERASALNDFNSVVGNACINCAGSFLVGDGTGESANNGTGCVSAASRGSDSVCGFNSVSP